MRRKALVGLLILPLLTMTACGSVAASTQHTTDARSTPPASASTSPTSAPPADGLPSGLVLGPTGLGPLRFGMTTRQANATGMLAAPATRAPEANRCAQYPLVGGTVQDAFVLISPDRGVVEIAPPATVPTPQDIAGGATLAQVRAAYPQLAQSYNGTKLAPVPGNPQARYRFAIADGKVLAITMIGNEDCAT
ncbi:hypothetical protein Asera_16950 [Actinocatenispora sera]|uniref:Lipoprotein n=2 Tax=Actinocatenispora sera TaxID=390989 RepID=A0A810KXE1_9ACTN|nr:hypothetical protein Asera_16950 [Actinocatenispora sera]